jgi:hypothetical protein
MTDGLRITTGDTDPITGNVGMAVVGASGEAHIKWYGGTVTTHAVDWTDTATGAFSIDVAADDRVPGWAFMEVQVTFSDGTIQTVGPARFNCREQIA